MKIGVISDIHSNLIAFMACTAYLEKAGCDEYLFLGDYVSDTPYTRETLDYLYEFIRKHPCHLLRGNREEYMISQRSVRKKGISNQRWIYNSASGNLLYAYEQLTEADLDFFEKLPISFVYEKEGYPAITCCHGSPLNARELLQLDSDRAKDWLDKIDTKYMICAHTHYPGECNHNGKHYYNSGCVGIAIEDHGSTTRRLKKPIDNAFVKTRVLHLNVDVWSTFIQRKTFVLIPERFAEPKNGITPTKD